MTAAASIPRESVPAPSPVPLPGVVLHGIPWDLYVALRDTGNSNVRMTYHDGTLYLMSPEDLHEVGAEHIALIVRALAEVLERDVIGAGSTTFRHRGDGLRKGAGKEPDSCFYIAHFEQVMRKDRLDLSTDPPPDLVIEVDNTVDSAVKLPVYARLGMPEVWLYDAAARTIWFGRLEADRTYRSVGQSVSFPMLTPAILADLIEQGRSMSDSKWSPWLRQWFRENLLQP